MERLNTHIVIKKADALKYLTEVEYQTLERLQTVIIAGRAKDGKKPVNNYYICNTDECYAGIVKNVILLGEQNKMLLVAALAEKGK